MYPIIGDSVKRGNIKCKILDPPNYDMVAMDYAHTAESKAMKAQG
jgi:hypothetical protein